MGEGVSPLITDRLGGGVIAIATVTGRGGSEGLQIAEATGDVGVLQAEAGASKLRT